MLLALGVGVLIGPRVFGVIDLERAVEPGRVLEHLARVALALSVFDIALRTTPSDLRRNAKRITILLAVVMPGMWLLTSLGAGLFLGFPLAVALLLGATLTPTDPGVASALVTGVLADRMLPRRVRMSLQVEAGANDGLALPFVVLSGLLATLPGSQAVAEWVVEVGRQLAVAVVVGLAVGAAVRWLTRLSGAHRLAGEDWFPLTSIGTSLTVVALAHVLGGIGVFAAFLAGLIFSDGLSEGLREPIQNVHRSATKIALTGVFIAFGMVLPFDRWWPELGAGGLGFALWTLAFRRLPVAFPAVRAVGTGRVSSAFIGWSGPLGVAAIYYLAYIQRYKFADYERVFLAGSLAVTASVVGQTVTSAAAVRGYARLAGAGVDEGEELEFDAPLP